MVRPSLPSLLVLSLSYHTLSAASSPLRLDARQELTPRAGLEARQGLLGGILGGGAVAGSSAAVVGGVTSAGGVVSSVVVPVLTSARVIPPVTSVASSVIPTVAPTTAMPTTSSVPITSSTPTTSRPASTVDLTSTILTTVTNAQGSASVSTALILPTLAANNTDTSGSTGKTWGIVGGVVGGIAVLAAGLFVFWRFTQRRFSDLDDARHDDIKWPELQPDGAVPASSSTLNPLGTRRTGRSGVEMGDEWDDGMGREGNYYDEGGYAPSTAGAYYDPYLGPSSAPHPAPQNIYPPQPPSARSYSPYYPDETPNYTSPPPAMMHSPSLGMGMEMDRGGRPLSSQFPPHS